MAPRVFNVYDIYGSKNTGAVFFVEKSQKYTSMNLPLAKHTHITHNNSTKNRRIVTHSFGKWERSNNNIEIFRVSEHNKERLKIHRNSLGIKQNVDYLTIRIEISSAYYPTTPQIHKGEAPTL
jgi:hypothetical protein